MSPRLAPLLVFLSVALPVIGAESSRLITYDNLPLGTVEAPLLLRSYLPDPDLDESVLTHHHRGGPSPRYAPARGEDVNGEYQPIRGLPAAIGVNHGPQLSYVFDTTEGRLLYAWQGGFVDMFPYWGNQERGNRQSFDYLPRLVGILFYKAQGKHPVEINGRSVSDLGPPRYVGYDLIKRHPEFIVRFGEQTVRTRVRPDAGQLALRLEISAEPRATLSWRNEDPRFKVQQQRTADGRLDVTLTGVSLGSFDGYPRRYDIAAANPEAGEELFKNYGCIVCHSTDGSRGHGPTLANLYNQDRRLANGATVLADEAYLLESIKEPNAKIAEGFPENFMPPYRLRDIENESLILFIKSLQAE